MKIGSLRRFWQVFKEEDLAEKKKEMWSSRFSFATLLYVYYFGWKMEGGIQALKSVSEAVNTNCVTKPFKHWKYMTLNL